MTTNPTTTQITVGILGGAGYTGVELLRLLAGHPHAAVAVITSRAEAGRAVAGVFPSLRDSAALQSLTFSAPDEAALSACDVVFCATPNRVAMTYAERLLKSDCKIIDLSADFRLKDEQLWEKWYGANHACPWLLAEAAYGLPEINRDAIRGARLVANPGCYPTAVLLGLAPLVEGGLVDSGRLIADVKSGVSGAGRKADLATSLGEAAESFKAYSLPGHRHQPETRQELTRISGGGGDGEVGLVFVPHLLPIVRGIHATLYARLNAAGVAAGEMQAVFERRYAHEPFVDVLPAGSHPDTRGVRGGNTCRLAVHRPLEGDAAGDTVVVLAVEDNLVKGAAGQAVQNMNLMFDLPETAGLGGLAIVP